MSINIYACGGTGINLAKAILSGAKTHQLKDARVTGMDTSDANRSDELFPVERVAGATRGSGKLRSLNYEVAIPFVKNTLSKNKPGSFNIVIANTAGGTGSTIATLTLRSILEQKLPLVLILISDHTSTAEKENSIGTLRGIANQVSSFGLPVVYLEFYNTAENNRGEVNAQVVRCANLLSLFLTEKNEEMDYSDIKHFFQYNIVTKIPPALSRLTFLDQNGVASYEGKTPVAVASLFETSDEVVPVFTGTTYRTTGVFEEEGGKPKGTTQLHMILDHGQAIAQLEEEIQDLADHRAEISVNYVKDKELGGDSKPDDNGMCF